MIGRILDFSVRFRWAVVFIVALIATVGAYDKRPGGGVDVPK